MRKFHGGSVADRGTYYSVRDGSVIAVQDGGILPGESRAMYYRIPFVLFFPLGLLLGGLYAALLPPVAAATGTYVLGRRLFGNVLARAGRSVSFGWRPTEAYLAGRSRRRGEEAEKEEKGEE